MSSNNFTDKELFSIQLRRLMLEVGVDNQKELAQVLGYKSSSAISNWKNRGIDWNKINEVFSSLDVNYIMTGDRSKVNQSKDATSATEPEVRYAEQVELPEAGKLSRGQMKYFLGQIESIARILKDSL